MADLPTAVAPAADLAVQLTKIGVCRKPGVFPAPQRGPAAWRSTDRPTVVAKRHTEAGCFGGGL